MKAKSEAVQIQKESAIKRGTRRGPQLLYYGLLWVSWLMLVMPMPRQSGCRFTNGLEVDLQQNARYCR